MMFAKFWGAALAAGVMGMLAVSTPAAQAQPAAQPAAKKPMAESKPTSHHGMSCYDYAWDSQEMKNCLAKSPSKKPMAQKTSATKKPAAKPAAKKAS